MKVVSVLFFSAAVLTVSARHKKEWELFDVKKASREVLSPLHHYDSSVCVNGPGFYRDPTDCHQYIRCVDDYSTGRRLSIFFGRCRPGLVFDENITSCNWPELAAPCSNSPEKLEDPSKFKEKYQQPISQDNVIPEHFVDNRNRPYNRQQQETRRPQDSQFPQEHENEVPNTLQEKINEENSKQSLKGVQTTHIEQNARWPQVQTHQEPIPQTQQSQEVITQEKNEQVFQNEDSQQKAEEQEPVPQPVVSEQSKDNEQEIHQQKIDHQIEDNQFQEQVQAGFQEIKDPEPSEQAQSQWWIPDSHENSHSNSPINDQHPVPTNIKEPILCSSEGFYRHPRNCSQFVRCVKTEQGAYSVHFFECANRLFFDEKSSACVMDESDKCRSARTKRQAPDSTPLDCSGEGFFRHPVDCRSFYRCVRTSTGNYETHLFSCPETLVFDEEYATCNWPDKAPPCETPRRFSKPTRPSPPSRQQYKPIRTTTKPKSDVFDFKPVRGTSRDRYTQSPKYTTQDPSRRQICNSPGFYRHDYDCTKFYKCVRKGNYFVRYELSCPNNFAYDASTSRCVSQKNLKTCNRRNTNFPQRQNDEEVSSTEAPVGASQPEKSDDDIQCEKEGFFRNPNDCNRFYRCVDVAGDGKEFTRYDFKCPDDLVFDEANSVCNWPDQSAPCDGRSGENGGKDGNGDSDEPNSEEETLSSSATTERTTTRSTTPQTSDESTTKEASESPSGPNEGTRGSGDSESGCSQEGFFRNPEDCNKFYRCVDFGGDGQEFIRYDFACPDGLVFDETNSVCNWPEDSPPCNSSPGENGKNQGESSTQKDQDTTTKRPATTPREISTSENTTPSSDRTSTDGSTTSSADKDGSTSSEGERDTSNTGECKEAGFFRNPEDCNKFYRCVDYNGDGQEFVKYDFACPDGLVFDEANSVCNWPDQSAPCDSDSGKEGGNTDSDTSNEKSTTPTASTSQESTSTDSRTTSRQTTSPSRRPTRRPTESTTGFERTSTSEDGTTSNDSTTKGDSNNNGECKEAGFFRNPEDCNKFYRCVDYNGDGQEFVKYDFSCPDGLVFDEANSVCNWPDQSAPCDGDSGKEGGDTDSEKSTTQGPGSTSSTASTEGSTSTDSSTTSRQTTSPPSRRPTRRPTESTTSSTTAGTSEEGTTSQDSSTKSEGSNTGDCKEAGFFRNPDDCNKFYRCVDFNGDGQEFVKYDFSCPEGLVFDEVNSVCNWPDQSPPCENGGGSTGEGTKGTESSTSKAGTSEEETTSQASTASGISTTSGSTSSDSEECTEPGFFRCKDDCTKFYRCVDENEYGDRLKRYDFKCPEGLLFDDKNKRCDFPSDELSCDDTALLPDSDSTTTTDATSQSTTPSITEGETTVGSVTSTSGTSSSQSGDECSEEGFFRDPNDCSKYYRCLDEGDGSFTREDFSCAEDEVFDEEMRYCNRKDLAPPCDESSTDKTQGTTESSSKSGKCTESGFFHCPEDCSKFYRCVDENGDGETYVRHNFTCPEGLIFDEKNKKCDWPSSELTCEEDSGTSSGTSTTPSGTSTTPSSTSSGTTSGSSGECTEEGFFRNPDDCSKYYRCLDEGDGTFTREDFSCAEDEVFDEEMRYCNRKDLAPPCDESSSDKITSSTTSSGTSTTPPSSSGTTSGSSGECTEEGFFRNPDDCSKYYRCLDEGDGTFTREDFSCAEDEVFDEEMRYCNRKDLAPPCDESSSSTTSSSTSNPEDSSSVTGESESSSSTEDTGTTSSSTSSGTESSTSSGECQKEGFHRHPDDCTKFYRCVDFEGDGKSFTKYEFECPEGLVFDETNSVCNWPSSAPPCDSSSGTSSTGESGTSTTQSVSDSTSDTASTDVTSGSITTTGSSESTTSSSDTENIDSSSTGSTSSTDGTTSGEKSSGDLECTEEGFFRHPDDCTKFYRCVDFAGTGESYVRYDFECPRDLVFDEVNSVCNWPNMSPPCDSGSRSDGNDTTTDASTSTSGSSDADSTTNSETTQASTTPPSTTSDSTLPSTEETTSDATKDGEFRCDEEGFFRDPNNCKKYYECKRDEDSGELVKIDCECPDGQIFDEEGWYCNAEELAKPCNDGSFKCQEEGFFRDPEDCTKYFRCNRTEQGGFEKKQFECENGTVFDEEGRYCNAPELSQPCDNSSKSSEPTTASENSSTGAPSESTSSLSTGTSSESSTSPSTGTSDQSGQCTEEGFFRNPEDCTQYYQCTRNEDSGEFDRKDFTCPDGRIFDEGVSYCNDPELSEEPCEGTSTDSSTTSGATSTTEAGGESSTTNPNTQQRRGGGDPECKEAGFFRHPRDCNKFYRCVDFAGTGQSFVRFDFDCPEGLHFDEVNSVCNWPTMTPGCTSDSEKNFIS